MNRRNSLKLVSAVLGATTLPHLSFGKSAESFKWEKSTILFQGDSITDGGRNREIMDANHPVALGFGYPLLAAGSLLGENPTKEMKFYNKGISGNKVFQLQERWQEDALSLKPNILSILIGVNDYWHTKSHDYEGTVDTYEDDFRKLLQSTLKELPNVQLVICEPFIVKGGQHVSNEWETEFPAYRKKAKKLAAEFNTTFIPFQAYFDEALNHAPASYWCPDGVHPSLAGSQLMAQAWMKGVGA